MKKLGLFIVSTMLLSACSKAGAPTTEEMPTGTVQTEQSQEQTTTDPSNTSQTQSQTSSIDVTATNYMYNVKEIKVSQGSDFTVNFTNVEGMHDFVIDDLNVNSGMVDAGSEKSIKIPTDKPGTYQFYCSVGNHKQMGMVGTLIVE